jgi:hypothetical protein
MATVTFLYESALPDTLSLPFPSGLDRLYSMLRQGNDRRVFRRCPTLSARLCVLEKR